MEQNGGNFYKPHYLMIDGGTFWRCKHGITGLNGNLEKIGCKECAWNAGFKVWIKFHINRIFKQA
jgi:hypothetical protein